jgi:CO/xanthine dehydrogenase Mo-binding subunit
VHILACDDTPRGVDGIGMPTVARALTNTIFVASGVRTRRLPIRDPLRAAAA